MTASAAARPARQRSVAADESITAATLALLGEHGYRGLTMLAVIERSGVSSATLYRRFPDKQALVVAALRTLNPDTGCIDTGALAGDVEALVRRVARAVSARDDLFAVLAMEVKYDDELRVMNRVAFIEPRLHQIRVMLERAVERGELVDPPPHDVVFSLVTGPIHHRAFVLGERLTPLFLRCVVVHVLAGLAAGSTR